MILLPSLLIPTKFPDCYTTHRYMRSVDLERNRLASKWMLRWGKPRLFGGILVVGSLTGLSYWLVTQVYTAWYGQWSYVLLALFISFTQAAAADGNFTGRLNAFTQELSHQRHYRRTA